MDEGVAKEWRERSTRDSGAMTAVDLIRRLHEHRQWANQSLIAAALKLSDGQLRQEFPICRGSVWLTLLHLYAGDYVWLEALLGDEEPLVPGDLPDQLPGNQAGQGAIQNLDELIVKWAALDQRWLSYLADLDGGDLDGLVAKKSTFVGNGKVYRTKVYDVLLHVCTHAQYTTAQAVNMLRQLGVKELPNTMLISLARQESDSTK